jgi:alpha-L-arabinofuranosidase
MAWRFGRRVKYTEAVVPHTKEYGKVKKSFEMTIPENSVGIIRLKPVK